MDVVDLADNKEIFTTGGLLEKAFDFGSFSTLLKVNTRLPPNVLPPRILVSDVFRSPLACSIT